MALRVLFAFLSFAGAFGEDVATALASDDVCEAGQDCSLELNQLRGIKVHYLRPCRMTRMSPRRWRLRLRSRAAAAPVLQT